MNSTRTETKISAILENVKEDGYFKGEVLFVEFNAFRTTDNK